MRTYWDTLKKRIVATAQKLSPYLETATEIGETIIQLPDKPGPLQYAALTAKVARQALAHSADSLRSGRWCVPFPYTSSFDELLPELIKEADPGIEVPAWEQGDFGRTMSYHEIEGHELYIESTGDDCMVCIRPEQRDEVVKMFGRLIWKKFGSNLRVNPIDSKDGGRGLSFDLQESVPLPSSTAKEILNDLQSYQGEPKSILLHGPPGTGKSCVAQFCGHSLGGKTLLIEPHVVGDYFVCLDTLLTMMEPDVLILDDLDRVETSSYLLSLFERIRGPNTVLIATANDTTLLDRALLRPGRFDELIEISQAPPDVTERLLAQVPAALQDRVREWEPAYLAELIRRVERRPTEAERAVNSLERHREIEQASEYKTGE